MRRTSLYQSEEDVSLVARLAAALAARSPGETPRDYGTTRVVRIALRHLAGSLGVKLEDRELYAVRGERLARGGNR